ncbi:MAG: glycosyltransferase [Coriobacteriales bacterium]|jgi:glycosyltransferase involved in cell wall biosynthesis|nr:glycosyltransferase [Coriobacteriales bacterium]
MTPAVSIIIPVYNSERYLARCLQSVAGQSYGDFEVLMIDDGSADGSAAICGDFEQADSRFRLIKIAHSGASGARNVGLDRAKGDYISFVDSDDTAEPNMIEVLIKGFETPGIRMVMGGIYEIYQDKKPYYAPLEYFLCSAAEALDHLLEGRKVITGLCNKMIERDAIGDLRFPVGHTAAEDACFTYDLIKRIDCGEVDCVVINTEPIYDYHHRQGSITTASYSEASFDVVIAYSSIYKNIQSDYPKLQDKGLFKLLWAYFLVFDQMLLEPNYQALPRYSEVLGFLRTHVGDVVRSPYFRKTRRIAARALAIHPRLYRFLLMRRLREQWGDKLQEEYKSPPESKGTLYG